MSRPHTDPASRFWSKVSKSPRCWIWTAAPNQDGYGRLKVQGRHILAHRFSWELHGLGTLGERTLDHRCRVRLCVNPNHLRIATQAENNQNRGSRRCNPTGIRGVTNTRNGRPYKALVVHNGKRHYLGRFDTLEAANLAAIEKRLEVFTHNEDDERAKQNATNAARRVAA